MVDDGGVSAPRRKEVAVPREAADSVPVPSEHPHLSKQPVPSKYKISFYPPKS